MASAPRSQTEGSSADLLKAALSVAIFIHFFCVAVVLASNFRRSPLQSHLVSIFAFYTQLLDFDPDRTAYHYTHGLGVEDDARLEVDLYVDADLPVAGQPLVKTVTLPNGGSNWLGDRRKHFTLAKILASNAQPDNEQEDVTIAIARAVGSRLMRETGNRRSVVRCIQRMSQPRDLAFLEPSFPRDNPTDPRYDVTLYEADVWIDEDNEIQSQKRASRAEVAPRQSSQGGSSSRSRGAAVPTAPAATSP